MLLLSILFYSIPESGELYSWGRNAVALGYSNSNPDSNNKKYTPQRVLGQLAKKKVVAIDGGYEHSIAVTGTFSSSYHHILSFLHQLNQ